jgi:hypothetical protein
VFATLLAAFGFGPPSAVAATPRISTKTYEQLNAFWHQRRPSRGDTYRRITWYAGAFREGPFFYSDLYRYVELCEPQPGPDACDRTAVQVGSTTDPNVAQLSVRSSDMSGGTLSGTYSLSEPGKSDPERVISVRVRLRGTGDVDRERSHRQRWKGDCLRARSTSLEERRHGIARGWLTGDVERNLHSTGDANIESETTTTIRYPC